MDRRNFLRLGASGVGLAALPPVLSACSPSTAYQPSRLFSQGVASGFHSDTEVVLWTRVEPRLAPTVTECAWEVATSAAMSTIVASGVAPVEASSDHTVKLLVDGLTPDTSYWYRFTAGGESSPVGRSRTLPAAGAEPTSLKLAFASCQAYACGYYAAWRDVAARDLDGVVFLGDYIYESGLIQIPRRVRDEPLAEALSLEDYRAKYRLYNSDPDLQAARAAHPWAVVWDDHELHNDWDRTDIAADPKRFASASRAWFEHQPIWPIDGTRIHRSLRWGRLAQLHLLDSRQYRDPAPPSVFGYGVMNDEMARSDRTMLGVGQRQWLFDGLSAAHDAGVRHQLLGNPVLLGPVRLLDLDTPEARLINPSLTKHSGLYASVDCWDGYPAERDALLAHVAATGIDALTVLTGDIHSFWAGALREDFDDDSSPVVAREFAGGAISSLPGGPQSSAGGTFPAWDFVDGIHNGYGIVECTPDAATVMLVGVDAQWRGATPAPLATFVHPL